jgi:hypothetical protein
MHLVEQHIIDRGDPRYGAINAAAFASKNLYNAALYEMRQAFIRHSISLSYEEMDKRMQSHEAYKALPAKVSQHVLKQLTPSMLPIEVKTAQDPEQIDQVRIVPRHGYYVVEIIYTKEPVQAAELPCSDPQSGLAASDA